MAGFKKQRSQEKQNFRKENLAKDTQRGRERWKRMSCASLNITHQEAASHGLPPWSTPPLPGQAGEGGVDSPSSRVRAAAEPQKNCQRGKMSGYSEPDFTFIAEP